MTCGALITSSIERYTDKMAQVIIVSLMPRDHANGQVAQQIVLEGEFVKDIPQQRGKFLK